MKRTTALLCLLLIAAFLTGCAVPNESAGEEGKAAAAPGAPDRAAVNIAATERDSGEPATNTGILEAATTGEPSTYPPADGTDTTEPVIPIEPLEKGEVQPEKLCIKEFSNYLYNTIWTSLSEEDFLTCLRAAAAEYPEEKLRFKVRFVNGIAETPRYRSLMEMREKQAITDVREWRRQLLDWEYAYGASRMETLQPLVDMLPPSCRLVDTFCIMVNKDVDISDIDELFVQTLIELTAYTDVAQIEFIVGNITPGTYIDFGCDTESAISEETKTESVECMG